MYVERQNKQTEPTNVNNRPHQFLIRIMNQIMNAFPFCTPFFLITN